MARVSDSGSRTGLRHSLPGALIRRAFSYEPRFTGRARRTELALVAITCIAASFVLTLVTMFDRTPFMVLNLLGAIALTGLPVLAAMVRRLHDANMHGWAIAVALFPYVGWAILAFNLLKSGTEGDNVFGPDPRA